jgi:hypothetical protein
MGQFIVKRCTDGRNLSVAGAKRNKNGGFLSI